MNSSICLVTGFPAPCPALLSIRNKIGRVRPILSRPLQNGGVRRLRNGLTGVSLLSMAGKWLELAQKMAKAARAGLAVEKKRLNEILAERQRNQKASSTQPSR